VPESELEISPDEENGTVKKKHPFDVMECTAIKKNKTD
jgi:hypothetical protein